MNIKEIPAFTLSAFATMVAAYLTHIHPEWSPFVVGIISCFVHHGGKEQGVKKAEAQSAATKGG